jgi:hypothetical protein
MKQFIKVTAVPCNDNGVVIPKFIPVELLINPSLILAIKGKEVFLYTKSEGLILGKVNYTNFNLF